MKVSFEYSLMIIFALVLLPSCLSGTPSANELKKSQEIVFLAESLGGRADVDPGSGLAVNVYIPEQPPGASGSSEIFANFADLISGYSYLEAINVMDPDVSQQIIYFGVPKSVEILSLRGGEKHSLSDLRGLIEGRIKIKQLVLREFKNIGSSEIQNSDRYPNVNKLFIDNSSFSELGFDVAARIFSGSSLSAYDCGFPEPQYLYTLLEGSHIESLSVGGNSYVNDDFVRDLPVAFTDLLWLDLANTNVTQDYVDRLQEDYPELVVRFFRAAGR